MGNNSSATKRRPNKKISEAEILLADYIFTERQFFIDHHGTKRRPNKKISEAEILPGDHIYTKRQFTHHGIYVEKDRVIHFLKSVDDLPFGFGRFCGRRGPLPCPECGHDRTKRGVVKSCLKCFLRGGKIYRYEYGYEKLKLFKARLMKYCTSVASDEPQTVIYRSRCLLREGFGKYCLFKNNCEHFALFCKTGVHIESGQVALHGTKRRPNKKISESEILPGDHIYTKRQFFIDHHGIYDEEDRVIHFLKSVDDLPFGFGSFCGGCLPCPECGHDRTKRGVVKSCLKCFLR